MTQTKKHLEGCGWPNSWVQNSNRFISIFSKSTAGGKYEKSNDKTAFVSCTDGWLNPLYRITCCGKTSLSVWSPSAQLVPPAFCMLYPKFRACSRLSIPCPESKITSAFPQKSLLGQNSVCIVILKRWKYPNSKVYRWRWCSFWEL